jgi:hypothetical protein
LLSFWSLSWLMKWWFSTYWEFGRST